MEHAAENARLHEFIASKGLTTEFRSFVEEHDRKQADLSRPEIDVEYQKIFSKKSRDGIANITPWLRTASLEDACRFADLVREEADTCNEEEGEDGVFLSGIVRDCLDEDELEWFHRAHSVRVMLYCVREEMLKALPDIRPTDFEKIESHLVLAKGPMGSGDASGEESVGTLL